MLSLTRKKKGGSVVGLDIEAGSIAAAEVKVNGVAQLNAAAVHPLEGGAFHEGEVVDSDRLVDGLKSLYGAHKLSKQVRLGVGNQRVLVRTFRLPAIEDPKEMDAAVRFQAQEQIPMPMDQAILEHQVVGGAPPVDGQPPQVDVVVAAARRDMVASLIEPVRRAGLEPVGVDLAAFGMIRALAPRGGAVPTPDGGPAEGTDAILYCNLGDAMNLAVARGRVCLFTRVSAVGLEQIAGRLSGQLGLTHEHATQWLTHVGLEQPVEQIEGDQATIAEARRAIEEGLTSIVDDLRLSLDYYGAQEGAEPATRVVVSGAGSAIPGLVQRMQETLGLPVTASIPSALSEYGSETAPRLTLPYGLALED
ncbi:MAG TPA: type IV pilus assembly protein PilM [Solirubrobacterales bacterium]|nr:type IV pilus assembly protein PilM [Solirubrobacterales bacterium]